MKKIVIEMWWFITGKCPKCGNNKWHKRGTLVIAYECSKCGYLAFDD